MSTSYIKHCIYTTFCQTCSLVSYIVSRFVLGFLDFLLYVVIPPRDWFIAASRVFNKCTLYIISLRREFFSWVPIHDMTTQ